MLRHVAPRNWLDVCASRLQRLEALDQSWKLHPILVNFTAALVPVSVLSDIADRLFHRDWR